jgi:hypothetical protein
MTALLDRATLDLLKRLERQRESELGAATRRCAPTAPTVRLPEPVSTPQPEAR